MEIGAPPANANQPHHRKERGAIEPLDLCGRGLQCWLGDNLEHRRVSRAGELLGRTEVKPRTRGGR